MRGFFISLFLCFNLFAQATYQDQVDTFAGSADPQTISTNSSATNGCWILVMSSSSIRTITSVTDNGSGLTWNELSNATIGNIRHSVHIAVGTQGSSFDVTVDFSGNTPINAAIFRYSGVDQTTPNEGVTTNSGTDDSPTVTQFGGSLGSGDLYIGHLSTDNIAMSSFDASYTSRYQSDATNFHVFAGESSSDGTYNHTLSTSGNWYTTVFILNEVASTANPSRGRIIIID